jgi:ubiquinone/menaquinone biosynthesis C-methylase UbiE
MDVKDLRQDWDAFGKADPLWAILTFPEKRGRRWDVTEFFDTGKQEIEALMKDVDSVGGTGSRSRALDFGCGAGRLTQALAGYFDEVHGVDVAPSMINLARRYNRNGDRCRYHLNDCSSLRLFEDNTFDLVYSVITLQHIDPADSKNYISEFVRTLAPGGLLVFQIPSTPRRHLRARIKHAIAVRLLWLFRRLGYPQRPIMTMHGIKREEVEDLLRQSGAQIVRVRQDGSAGDDWISYRYFARKKYSAAA